MINKGVILFFVTLILLVSLVGVYAVDVPTCGKDGVECYTDNYFAEGYFCYGSYIYANNPGVCVHPEGVFNDVGQPCSKNTDCRLDLYCKNNYCQNIDSSYIFVILGILNSPCNSSLSCDIAH